MMKFLILLLSVILSVRAIDVRVEFDNISSPPGTYTINIQPTYPKNKWVPISFNFTLFKDITAPFPTNWVYSINKISIANGVEDFCDPTPMTPGGIAIQLLLHGLDLSDKKCPLKTYTRATNLPWTWAEVQSLDLDDIFDAAAAILSGASMDSDVSPNAATDPSTNSVSGGMKRRRRDSSPLSVQLDILNENIDTRLILTAEV